MTYIIYKTPYGDSLRCEQSDGLVLHIPSDPANTDYQRYLAWLADGNEPELVEG